MPLYVVPGLWQCMCASTLRNRRSWCYFLWWAIRIVFRNILRRWTTTNEEKVNVPTIRIMITHLFPHYGQQRFKNLIMHFRAMLLLKMNQDQDVCMQGMENILHNIKYTAIISHWQLCHPHLKPTQHFHYFAYCTWQSE